MQRLIHRVAVSAVTALACAVTPALAAASPAPPALPVPHVYGDGPALTFDFPGVEIGVAEYEEGPTGTTVIYFPKTVEGVVDTRGGAPGTINTDALRLGYGEDALDAIVLSGGSSYGLSAATGVANAIRDARSDPGNWQNVPTVAGAIVFDLGDRRFDAVTPDDALGRAAWQARRAGWVPLGARGGGRFVLTGGYFGPRQHSGQGAAFRQSGDLKVLVVTVVNASGLVVDRSGHPVRCAAPVDGRCAAIAELIDAHLAQRAQAAGPVKLPATGDLRGGLTAHTTITAVIVNEALPVWALQRLAIQVHTSMARAIQPFSMLTDGDTLFAATTGAVSHEPVMDKDVEELSVLASETAWDAVLASVPALPAPTPRTNIAISPQALDAIAGRYAFAPGAIAEVRRVAGGLEIELEGRTSFYLATGRALALTAVATDEFEIEGPRGDRLRVDRDARGAVVGITINPGPWPVRARRVAQTG